MSAGQARLPLPDDGCRSGTAAPAFVGAPRPPDRTDGVGRAAGTGADGTGAAGTGADDTGRTGKGLGAASDVARPAPDAADVVAARAVGTIGHEMDTLAGLDVRDLTGTAMASLLADLETTTRRLAGLRARLLTALEADGRWAVDGSRSFSAWLRRATGSSPHQAWREARTARALREHLPTSADALTAGAISTEHAHLLATHTTKSPERIAALAHPQIGEAFLLDQAQRLDAGDFAKLVRAWAIAADPAGADGDYAEHADRQELVLAKALHGYHLQGWLTDADGAALEAALSAVVGVPDAADGRTTAQRRAGALLHLARLALDSGTLMPGAAVRPHVNVHVPHDTLTALVAAQGPIDRPAAAATHEGAGEDCDARPDGAALTPTAVPEPFSGPGRFAWNAPPGTRTPHPQPDHAQPDHAQPDHAQPDHAQPDHAQPDHAQPDHAQPDHAQPDHARPDRARPDRARPGDRARPDHPELDGARHADARPSDTHPGDAPSPDSTMHLSAAPPNRAAPSPGSSAPAPGSALPAPTAPDLAAPVVISGELDYPALIGAIPAELDDGTPIPPSLLARLACDSELARVIFGPTGEVLDVGRTQRLFPPGQRRAVIARDRHCAFPDCDAPPAHGEIHHSIWWYAQHGTTRATDGVLLCWYHHDYVHAHHITITRTPSSGCGSTDASATTAARWVFTRRNGTAITPRDPAPHPTDVTGCPSG